MDIPSPNDPAAMPGGRPWRAPFVGTLVALLLLAGVEYVLHTDAFLYRYRAVFAAGRAMDKLLALEAAPPTVLAVGNSRVDNGIHPEVFARETGLRAFNLGLPGAEACNVEGVIERLAERDMFGPGRVEQVLFGLDDGYFQRVGGLGYEVFFDRRERLLEHGRHRDWLRSVLRLWGYVDSLRTLQEPAKLIRFVEATFGDVASWGGNARDNAGFRAADEVGNQDAGQAAAQRSQAPDSQLVDCMLDTVNKLRERGVTVKAFFPPLLHSTNAFAGDAGGSESRHALLKDLLASLSVEMLDVDVEELRDVRYFANAGHLNRRGAERYTRLVAARLGGTRRSASME